jgi:hypothetical protein
MTVGDDPVGPLASSGGPDPRRSGRDRSRRRVIRRRRGALLILVVAAVLGLWISGAGGGSHAARVSSVAGARNSIVAPTSAVRRTAPVRVVAPSPGSLPQTHAYPSGTSARFRSLMASLWTGIVHDSLTPALAAFFPKNAYVQLKAIASASSDWSERLVRDYGLDIAAAHALLGSDTARASLIAVNVPSSYGHWIQPGVCSNSIGYYEVANARMVYRANGQIRSFGIASMISWRGVWYVVHLGAILRSADSGTVDEPAAGPGSPVYSGTC